MAKAYITSNPVIRPNGDTYSHICNVERVQINIPEDAEKRPGTDGDFWNWSVELANGGRINLQAYGQKVEPGVTATFEVEVRERKMSAKKGGYAFIYLKLKPTDLPANAQLLVADGSNLREVEDINNPEVRTIWCPQEKHDGGVIFAPLHVDLQAPVDHPLAQVFKKIDGRKVSRTRRAATA